MNNRLRIDGGSYHGHIHMLEATLPKTTDEIITFTKAIAVALAEGCDRHNKPLAAVAYGFVGEEGAIPEIVEAIAKSMEVDESRVGLAFLAGFGKELLDAEIAILKSKLAGDGLDKMTPEWLNDHGEGASFAWTVHTMEELTCDCPACIMFWAAKGYKDIRPPSALVDEMLALVKTEPERGNAGCVKHKIPDTATIKWLRLDS